MRETKVVDGQLSDPEIVWHYTSAEALINIVQKHELWAFSAAFMNDAQEIVKGSDMLNGLYQGLRSSMTEDAKKALDSSWFPNSSTPPSMNKFLLSASKLGDSLTMWRNYGQDGRGYAVGLDRNAPLALLGVNGDAHPYPPDGHYDPVDHTEDGRPIFDNLDAELVEHLNWTDAIYDPELQERALNKVLIETTSDWAHVSSTGWPGHDWRAFASSIQKDRVIHQIKDQGFSDEREVRMAIWCNPPWKFVKYRANRFGAVPYIRMTGREKERREITESPYRLPIRKVSVGPNAHPAAAEASLRQLLEMNGYHEVEVLSSKTPYR